jgi:hypothetical protein
MEERGGEGGLEEPRREMEEIFYVPAQIPEFIPTVHIIFYISTSPSLLIIKMAMNSKRAGPL